MGTAERADGGYWELPGPGGMALGACLGLRPAPTSAGPRGRGWGAQAGPSLGLVETPREPLPKLGGFFRFRRPTAPCLLPQAGSAVPATWSIQA